MRTAVTWKNKIALKGPVFMTSSAGSGLCVLCFAHPVNCIIVQASKGPAFD